MVKNIHSFSSISNMLNIVVLLINIPIKYLSPSPARPKWYPNPEIKKIETFPNLKSLTRHITTLTGLESRLSRVQKRKLCKTRAAL